MNTLNAGTVPFILEPLELACMCLQGLYAALPGWPMPRCVLAPFALVKGSHYHEGSPIGYVTTLAT